MLKKSLLLTVLLLIGHYAIIKLYTPIEPGIANLWDSNLIKAEKFIYDQGIEKDIIIVGSSLAAKLIEDSLPKRSANLALDGQSIYDGLEILLQLKRKPKLLLIESNVIERKISESFINSLFSVVMYPARKKTNLLRTKNKPEYFADLAIEETIVKPVCEKFINKLLYKIFNPISEYYANREGKPDMALRETMLEITKENIDNIILEKKYEKSVELLDKYIAHFSNLGTQIVFFEMPESTELCNNSWANFRDTLVIDRYKSYNVHYSLNPNCAHYTTSDAVHLDKESATKFTKQIVNLISTFEITD